MFEGEGTGVGAAPIPVSRPATTATLTTAPASSTGGGNVPGIDKPFRPANPAHPPNAAVVERMNSLQPHHNMDCSEIADTLQRTAGGGRILHVTGRGGKDLKLFENGQISAPEFAYHQVFTDGRYIYDPLLSKTAVPLGDWECFIRTLNPGALIK
jgi:filamentous hemagglutinin